MEINSDITGRRRAEDAARKLSGRLLTMQDEERRRIARGLHDSLGQYLTAAKMNLDLIVQAGEKQTALASQCSEILNTCLTETRTVSHLLHPPLLDDAGLGSAIRWYAEGFAERSSIQVNLDLPEELRRLPKETEIALFRAVQEGLTNVHRHSGSSAVDVRLRAGDGGVRLEVKDNGQGIPEPRLRRITEGAAEVGVGIAGMRERVRQLGGKFEIESDPKGTLLRVSLPVSDGARPPVGDNPTQRTPAA
jgi:two-component system, NarL family, sensor kinase